MAGAFVFYVTGCNRPRHQSVKVCLVEKPMLFSFCYYLPSVTRYILHSTDHQAPFKQERSQTHDTRDFTVVCVCVRAHAVIGALKMGTSVIHSCHMHSTGAEGGRGLLPISVRPEKTCADQAEMDDASGTKSKSCFFPEAKIQNSEFTLQLAS